MNPLLQSISGVALAQIENGGMPRSRPDDRPKEILELVHWLFGITEQQLKSKNRKEPLVFIRHMTVYVLSKCGRLNQRRVSELLDRDHSSIINSLHAVKDYFDSNDHRFMDYWNYYLKHAPEYLKP
jgi:chromosomal replication initiation ATPase DnaA